MKRHHHLYRFTASFLFFTTVLCSTAGTFMPVSAQEAAAEEAQGTLPEADKSVYMDPSRDIETRIDALLEQMTLEEKAAQMTQPEQDAIMPADIVNYNFGSILSGGGSVPSGSNTTEGWGHGVNAMKSLSLQSRLGIPLLYGVDAVHGHNNVTDAVIFPHNIGLGCADDEELMERIGRVVAAEVRATGIQWTFAPTLANPQNELWGRTYEGFGEDAELVSRLGAAFIRGVQGEPGTEEWLDRDHILATAKHYIGEGYTMYGMNQGDVRMTEDEFEELLHSTLLLPYQAAIEAGVRTVMVSYNSVLGVKCHEHGYLIQDVLKGELGFTGLVVSDYNGIDQVSGSSFKDKVANSVNAGIDLFMEPKNWKEFMTCLVELVKEGSVSEERIDDAVRRILRVKFEAGLFDSDPDPAYETELMENFGSEEHREVAREAVRKSLVLLKNESMGDRTAMQALHDAQHIRVLGKKADDIGAQCGGWTISWQGSLGDITEGTTILEGLQNAAGSREVTYSRDASLEEETDAVIVVAGETPYAEGQGDRPANTEDALMLPADDRKLLNDLETALAESDRQDIPVILILLSGRPMTITEYTDSLDGIVAAWLPGTEGEGIADVLLGDHDFTGMLSHQWIRRSEDLSEKYDADRDDLFLFRKGDGLTRDGSRVSEALTGSLEE